MNLELVTGQSRVSQWRVGDQGRRDRLSCSERSEDGTLKYNYTVHFLVQNTNMCMQACMCKCVGLDWMHHGTFFRAFTTRSCLITPQTASERSHSQSLTSEDSLGLHRLSRPSFPSSPTGLRTMSPLSPTSPASEALAEACVRENRITTYRDARFRRIAGASLGAITLLSSAAVQAPHYGLVSIAFTASSYVCMQGLFHQ